jgi:large subunit ribosomal protein L5
MSTPVKTSKGAAAAKTSGAAKTSAASVTATESSEPTASTALGVAPAPRLRELYKQEIVPALMREFKYRNIMQAPALSKVVLNIGMGEATGNPKALDAAVKDLAIIAGQKPIVKRSKKSIANFKLRAGMPIGIMVTLRGVRMYQFVDKLVSVSLPRQRDFRGISGDAFDGRGNYTLGLKEQLIFPEIEYDKVDKVRGLEISIVTTARTDQEGRRLLKLMGMPFKA